MSDSDIGVLDAVFPIDASGEQSPFFNGMVRDSRDTLDPAVVERQIWRAGFEAGIASVVAAYGGERRFVQPLPPELPPAEWTAEVVHEEPLWEPPTEQETGDLLTALEPPLEAPWWRRLRWRWFG